MSLHVAGAPVCQAAKSPLSHGLITPKLLLSPTVWDGPAGSKTAASVLLFLLKLSRGFGGGSGEIFISRAALTILTSVLSAEQFYGTSAESQEDPQRSKSVWGEALCSGRASIGAL